MTISDWVTEPQDAEGQELREVYALAGLALRMAQVLEHGISNCLVLLDISRLVKEGRRRFRSYPEFADYIDDLEASNFRRTLGILVAALKSVGVSLPDELEANCAKSLAARNRLAHHFFREHASNLLTKEGRRLMAKELEKMRELFKATDGQFDPIIQPIASMFGMTEEYVEELSEMMRQGASGAELLAYVRSKINLRPLEKGML